MSEVPEQIEYLKNIERSRYEVHLDGQLVAFADFHEHGDVVVLPHTETLPAFGGRGMAAKLVRFALDDVAAQGKSVNPACPFVASFIRRNPEYARLLER